MSRINLLPWREEQRKDLQKNFFISLGIVAVFSILIWGLIHFYYVQKIDRQNKRLHLIQSHIKLLDKRIEEIRKLEKEKDNLLERMEAIEGLQVNRPLIVRFFDELVKSLPDGVSVISVVQKGNSIEIKGVAESNARVSSFMRNLDASEWLANPDLKIIRANDKQNKDDKQGRSIAELNNFTLKFSQVVPKSNGDEEEDGE